MNDRSSRFLIMEEENIQMTYICTAHGVAVGWKIPPVNGRVAHVTLLLFLPFILIRFTQEKEEREREREREEVSPGVSKQIPKVGSPS